MDNKNLHESKLIILTALDVEMKDAIEKANKWPTVIDIEGSAEIFFKYQGTILFHIDEKEMQPENLCRTLLKIVAYPRTMTINFLDLPYQNIFNDDYFPVELLDPSWVQNYQNIEKLRQKFPEEFKDEIRPCKDFRLVFLFRKDNVPPILHEKTIVLEICKKEEIQERLAKREAEASKKEETKTNTSSTSQITTSDGAKSKNEAPKKDEKKTTTSTLKKDTTTKSSLPKKSDPQKTTSKTNVSSTSKGGTTKTTK